MPAAQDKTTRRFTVIFEKEDEGSYHVFCPTLPGCHTQSENVEEGIANIKEASSFTLKPYSKTAGSLKPKTLRSIIDDLGVSVEEFERMR